MPRYLFKKDRQLADQSLLTADRGLAALTVRRRPGRDDIRPRRRFAAQHVAQRGLRRQLVEGFQDRQGWFRAREAFGTTSGADATRRRDFPQEWGRGSRLADSRFAGQRPAPTMACAGAVEGAAKRVELLAASDDQLPRGPTVGHRSGRDAVPAPLDGARKAITDTGDGDDQPLVFVAQRLAQDRDIARQAG